MLPKPILPILEKAKELLDYDPETGVFTWKIAPLSKPSIIGNAAGTPRLGYSVITIDRTGYRAHRLAWAWVHGEEPPAVIDHVDGKKDNNAISNLRDGAGGVNAMNRPVHRAKNLVGVCFQEERKRFLVSFRNKAIYVGRDFFEAVCARKSAECKFWAAV